MAKISSRQRREAKRQAAKQRQEAFDALSDEQRLQKLLDKGHGNCKEARKLTSRINNG